MNNIILLAVIFASPIAIFTLLRIDAVLVFLSLCLGEVLVKFVGGDVVSFISAFSPHARLASSNSILIALILLPALLTSIAMFHSVKGSRILINILPSVCFGLVSLLLIEPLMSPGMRGAIENLTTWQKFSQTQTIVVGLSAVIIVVLLWTQNKGGKAADKKHR